MNEEKPHLSYSQIQREGVRSCILPSPFLAGQSCSPHNSGVQYALQFPFGINHALDELW